MLGFFSRIGEKKVDTDDGWLRRMDFGVQHDEMLGHLTAIRLFRGLTGT